MVSLLVIVPDRISDIITKGEYIPRYYNPGNLFDEVHIIMTNDDCPDRAALQKTAGRAKLFIYNLPPPSFIKTLGWQSQLIKKWVDDGIQVAKKINPAVIRTHGNLENGYLALHIKKALNVPLVVSLHINPDEDVRGRISLWNNWKNFFNYFYTWRMLSFENETLNNADWVLPVYEPIREYAHRHGARKIKVCYNIINQENLQPKISYELNEPPHIISVGRQFAEKNPDNIIRAIACIPNLQFTIVGDGPYHENLINLVCKLNLQDRVFFRKSIPNDELCQQLHTFDIFVTHTEYYELSKSVLESLLCGLPVLLNKRKGYPVPELQGDFVCLANNTPDDYYNALKRLLDNHDEREQLGRRAFEHAQSMWAPEKTELEYKKIYQSLLFECNRL